ILWTCFHAFGVLVPFGVLVMGFFLGMVANLAPSPAAGVGTVDAGLIGAFVLFGVDADTVFPAILMYRLVGFWLPIPVGVAGYFRLRKLIRQWEAETQPATIQSKVTAEAT
ncbi:MAG: putative heme transporter, partial [Thermoleophilaceae bacterium]|nr:putative heme transporter [Thermoleophilaceae bacterium]